MGDLEAAIFFLGGVRPSPLVTSAAIWPMYQPRMTDDEECGAWML